MNSLQVIILLTMAANLKSKFLLVETEKSGKSIAEPGFEAGEDYNQYEDYLDYNDPGNYIQ